MTPFEYLVQALANYLDIELHVDPHQSCKIQLSSGLSLQIDLSSTADHLFIGSTLGKVAPGSYQTQILEKALIVNGISLIPRGSLGFHHETGELFLVLHIPLDYLSNEKFCNWVSLFIEHAQIWYQSLLSQSIPPLDIERS